MFYEEYIFVKKPEKSMVVGQGNDFFETYFSFQKHDK